MINSKFGTPNGRVIVKTEVEDLDVLQHSFISVTPNSSNGPVTGLPDELVSNRAMVLNMEASTHYRVQLAFSFGIDKIAIRRIAGDDQITWTDWKYLSI